MRTIRIGDRIVVNLDALAKVPGAPAVSSNDWDHVADELVRKGAAEPYEGLAIKDGCARCVLMGRVWRIDRDRAAYMVAKRGDSGTLEGTDREFLEVLCRYAGGIEEEVHEPLIADPFGRRICEAVLEEENRVLMRRFRGRFWNTVDDLAMLYDYVMG